MDLGKKRSAILFTITLALTLFIPPLFPHLRLIFFAPFLITAYYQKSYASCLWLSFFCGLILDLLSSSFIGLHALNYCLITGLLFPQRRHFFADNLSTLPIMVFFFSFLSTLFEAILIHTYDSSLTLSLKWIFIDLFLMPCFDAIYAFGCFIFPFFAFGKKRRRGKDYFLASSG